ncbi:MAG: RluA family pseudouridine synthase [Aureliella sp.]
MSTTESADHPSVANQARFTNVAAYKFAALEDLEALRAELKTNCLERGLRGTILLSPEGINLFLCGANPHIHEFLDDLRRLPGLETLEGKFSYSDKVPFRRMLVRLKKEIIPCGMETIRPAEQTSPKLSAKELKRWLDEGKKVRLLDTRNNYEVELGTFEGAEQLDIGHFREFPDAIKRLPEEAKNEPLVMFCTGGIRCEKAGPIMEQAGYKEVYQLDGGILKYFEECGESHYDGSCFVFDGRVALDPELQPTGDLLCFACQAVLTSEDVASGKFRFGEYCPRCYVDPEEIYRQQYGERQAKILSEAEKQPGSTPYTNKRQIHVSGKLAGTSMLDFLERYQPRIGREQWETWLAAGDIKQEDGSEASAQQVVREGQRFVQLMPNTVEPAINSDIRLIHEDEALVVVNKPAPLPSHPSGRYNRNTLLWILSRAYPNEKLRMPHRLDSLTTGVMVLPRKYRPARHVQQQFEERSVDKTYLARVQGLPDWEEIDCNEPISSTPADEDGMRIIDSSGKAARTRFRRLLDFGDGTALVEARPLTGRTNQIRIHLKHLGHSICGDPVYGDAERNAELPPAQSTGDGMMCLHAWRLQLEHPQSGELVQFEAPKPSWAEQQG